MNYIDLAGIPFPLSHEAFKSDRTLVNKVRSLNIHIEMLQEYQQAYSLVEHLQKEEIDRSMGQFGAVGIQVPDMLFSFAVVQYAKSFVESQGSTNLISKIPEIFAGNGEKQRHEYFMELRHKFYAHRQLNANSNQLLYHQNFPEQGDISFMSAEQRTYIVMYRTVNLDEFLSSAWCVIKYLRQHIEKAEQNIIESLSDEQRSYMLETDAEQLRLMHQDDGNHGMSQPFEHRSKSS